MKKLREQPVAGRCINPCGANSMSFFYCCKDTIIIICFFSRWEKL